MADVSSNDENINVTWLNNSILETAIKSSEQDENLQVTSYQLTRATAAGDNYASNMYRVRVQYITRDQSETISLIIKAIPSTEEMARFMIEAKVFMKEALALSSVMTNMYCLLEEASPNQFQPFSPKCFYSHSSPDFIIMEDLKEKGFKMAKRSLGLDMKHSMLVMRKIARYHASSVVLHEKNPEIFQIFCEKNFNEDSIKAIDNIYRKGMKNLAKEVEGWPYYGYRYAKKLHNLAEESTNLVLEMMQSDNNDFNVFCHGDLWLNNMMFFYSDDTGDVENVRFVDFQICRIGDPATDILYFLHTSVSRNLMDEHDKLIKEYHNTLKETFKLLGYEHLAPSMVKLQKQLDKKRKYAIIVCGTVLPIVLADPNHIPDMDQVLKNANSVYFSDIYKKTIKRYLTEFERKGWL